jgi:CxxC motif-containing protein (DUF1111 family)
MRRSRHSTHFSLYWLTLILATVNTAFLLSQTSPTNTTNPTNNGAIDIGPRNPGNAPFTLICPVTGPVKFNNTVPNCVDLDQPPSQSPQPPAGGAGNVAVGGGPLVPVWFESINVFEEVASVSGTAVGQSGNVEAITGLGPAFNSNSCVSCHSAPVVGGSSPGSIGITQANGSVTVYNMPLNFGGNPELAAMIDQGASNSNPSLPTQFNTLATPQSNIPVDGPVFEVRTVAGGGSGGFVVQKGGVAELFTIQGRSDAPTCTLAQFPFTSLGARSISLRIPTPTFGLGFVEATPDANLVANLSVTNNTVDPGSATGLTFAQEAAALDISGLFNRSVNDGTITRFGWKAQNKSLLIFAGEASNVEMGVTNELFPNDKTVATGASCPPNVLTSTAAEQPEDELLQVTANTSGSSLDDVASIISANSENNRVFMLLNAAPSQCDAVTLLTTDPYGTSGPAQCPPFTTTQVTTGQTLFNNNTKLGCALCHIPSQLSGPSQNAALSNQTYHPYSDFALHVMGDNTTGLADDITQGLATSQLFRTAPLWGIGQRIFFLHDGRATDLATAIQDHCPAATATSGPSTANESCGAISNFDALTKQQQQDILDFLRSL